MSTLLTSPGETHLYKVGPRENITKRGLLVINIKADIFFRRKTDGAYDEMTSIELLR